MGGGDENERMRLSFLWQIFNDTVGGVAFKCGIPVKTNLSICRWRRAVLEKKIKLWFLWCRVQLNASHFSQHSVGTVLLNVTGGGGGEEQLNVTLYLCRKAKALTLLHLQANNQKDH